MNPRCLQFPRKQQTHVDCDYLEHLEKVHTIAKCYAEYNDLSPGLSQELLNKLVEEVNKQ